MCFSKGEISINLVYMHQLGGPNVAHFQCCQNNYKMGKILPIKATAKITLVMQINVSLLNKQDATICQKGDGRVMYKITH